MMIYLTLLALLLNLGITDGAKKKKSAPAPHLWGIAPSTTTTPLSYEQEMSSMGKVWFSFGYGIIKQEFDEDGKKVDLAQRFTIPVNLGPLGNKPVHVVLPLQTSSMVSHIGGMYQVYAQGDIGVEVGADLTLASVTVDVMPEDAEIDASAVPDALRDQVVAGVRQQLNQASDLKSGFKPQGVTPFVYFSYQFIGVGLGYQVDLGPEPQEEDEIGNSDQQNALRFMVDVDYPVGDKANVFAQFAANLTQETTMNDVKVDNGDVFAVMGGGSYLAGPVKVGAVLGFRKKTTMTVGGNEVDGSDASIVTLAPFAAYQVPNMPLSIMLRVALTREYYDYALPLTGKNDIAPTIGGTIHVVYNI